MNNTTEKKQQKEYKYVQLKSEIGDLPIEFSSRTRNGCAKNYSTKKICNSLGNIYFRPYSFGRI